MNIVTTSEQNVLTVKPVGRLDAVTFGELDAAFGRLIQDGNHRILLDLGGVTYISSAGLRSVISAAKKLQAAKGKLHLTGVTGMVEEVFKLSGFYDLLPVFGTREDALAKF